MRVLGLKGLKEGRESNCGTTSVRSNVTSRPNLFYKIWNNFLLHRGPLNWYRTMEKDWRWNCKIAGRKVTST